MSQPIFYEGQEVGCLMFGEGVIACLSDETLSVDFNDFTHSFNLNGAWILYTRPTLYPIDQYRSIIANLPAPQPEAWKPKPREWCWFWDNNHAGIAIVSNFVSYEKQEPYPYLTAINIRYENCAPFTGELPEHLKEVQPCTCTPDETTGETQFPGKEFRCNICGKEVQP